MDADEATMDHLEVATGRVVDRYLRGSLDPEEAQRFERHYLACPECLEELETTEELIDGLRAAAAEDVVRATVGAGLAARLARVRWRLAGAALAALLALPAVLLYSRLAAVGAELDGVRSALAAARAPQAALAVLPLNPLRGESGGAPRRIRLGETPGWVVLDLELDRPSFPRYRVTLRDAAGTELWRGDGLAPDARDTLALTVHSATLGPGEHAVEVAGLDEAGTFVPVARFAFQVVAD